jgi:hypothetical protein
VATNLKKPTSSKKIDKIVIEKKIINILIGLIAEEEVIPSNASFKDKFANNKILIAPNKEITQKVLKLIFLILIFGKNNIDNINNTQVIIEIMIVGSINISFYNPTRLYSSIFKNKSKKLNIYKIFIIKLKRCIKHL